MPTTGLKRYGKLLENITNPVTYLYNKIIPSSKVLHFITKPIQISFKVYQGKEHLLLIFKEIFLSDLYAINELCAALPKKPVIVDIGMNVGFFDILLLSKINVKRIYAYEPIPSNIKKFQETIDANKLVFANMNVYQMAVTGTKIDSVDLYLESADISTVNASIFMGFDKSHKEKLTVPCISLTDIILTNSLETIDYLKMDCEGSEFDILYNTNIQLVRRISRIAVEVHDMDNDTQNVAYLSEYLKKLGYSISHFTLSDTCHLLNATKK